MGRYDQVIGELRAQRDKIDAAIVALEDLGGAPAKEIGGSDVPPRVDVRAATAAVIKTATARVVRRAKADSGAQATVRTGRPTSTTHDAIMDSLRNSPKRSAALISELSPMIEDGKVRAMLGYLKKTGRIRQNDAQEWVVVS